jgi:nucleoside-diphosphate-sugar epimerase
LKVLLIGGNRFLGHELALRLVAASHAVTLFNRGTLADALSGASSGCGATAPAPTRARAGRPPL